MKHKMPSAPGEFGKAKNADVANKVMAVLGDSKEATHSSWNLKHRLQWFELDSWTQCPFMLNSASWGEIMWGNGDRWRPDQDILWKELSSRILYVDYSISQRKQPKWIRPIFPQSSGMPPTSSDARQCTHDSLPPCMNEMSETSAPVHPSLDQEMERPAR